MHFHFNNLSFLILLLILVMIAEERTSRVANGHSKRRRVSTNQTVIDGDLYINLEVSSGSMVIIEIFSLDLRDLHYALCPRLGYHLVVHVFVICLVCLW